MSASTARVERPLFIVYLTGIVGLALIITGPIWEILSLQGGAAPSRPEESYCHRGTGIT